MSWPGATMTHFCLVNSGRPSVEQPTGRGKGVSSWTTNALKPDDLLQRFSRKIIPTYVCPPWKNPHAQTSRIMGKYPKWYSSTSRRMMSHG